MLEKGGLDFIACCDFCSETLDTEESDWHAAIEAMKKAGWKIFKLAGEWWHRCPECQESPADQYEDVS